MFSSQIMVGKVLLHEGSKLGAISEALKNPSVTGVKAVRVSFCKEVQRV